jgi:23S rRNA (adenine2503-C2)-methyltransferase
MLGMSLEEITAGLSALGEPAYRARQVYGWVYERRAATFAEMTNLPATLRARLESAYPLRRPGIVRVERSGDGTLKYLLEVAGGNVESVLMPESDRITFCISSQVGCALDCRFCLTATMGFGRHLSAGEIVGQVLVMLADPGIDGRPVNLVFMGMGEPLHNYDQVIRAFRLLSDPGGVGFPWRRITVSTAGLVPGIRRLGLEPARPRLAISLNATTDETRSRIMPINRKHPLRDLLDAAAAYPLPPRERLTFEYVMLEGVNASREDSRRLAALVRKHRLRAKVNLIPFNSGGGLPYHSPPDAVIRDFRDALLRSGVPCSIRKNRGRDISAACGQLAVSGPPSA